MMPFCECECVCVPRSKRPADRNDRFSYSFAPSPAPSPALGVFSPFWASSSSSFSLAFVFLFFFFCFFHFYLDHLVARLFNEASTIRERRVARVCVVQKQEREQLVDRKAQEITKRAKGTRDREREREPSGLLSLMCRWRVSFVTPNYD